MEVEGQRQQTVDSTQTPEQAALNKIKSSKFINDYEKKLRGESNKFVISNYFFEHVFLERYIDDEIGNDPYTVDEYFDFLLSNYNPIYENQEMINKNTFIKDKLVQLIRNSMECVNLLRQDYLGKQSNGIDMFKNKGIEILLRNNELFLHLGWSGHSVSFYIKKNDINLYNLEIFNSGDGLGNHNLKIDENKSKEELRRNIGIEATNYGNIGIEYTNLTIEEIEYFLHLEYLIFSKEIYNEYKELRGNFKKHYFELSDDYNENERKFDEELLKENSKARDMILKLRNNKFRSLTKTDIIFKIDFSGVLYEYLDSLKNETKKKNIIFKDFLQKGSSCTYMSIYYFIKYFIKSYFTNIDKFKIYFYDLIYFIKWSSIQACILNYILNNENKDNELKQYTLNSLLFILKDFKPEPKDNLFLIEWIKQKMVEPNEDDEETYLTKVIDDIYKEEEEEQVQLKDKNKLKNLLKRLYTEIVEKSNFIKTNFDNMNQINYNDILYIYEKKKLIFKLTNPEYIQSMYDDLSKIGCFNSRITFESLFENTPRKIKFLNTLKTIIKDNLEYLYEEPIDLDKIFEDEFKIKFKEFYEKMIIDFKNINFIAKSDYFIQTYIDLIIFIFNDLFAYIIDKFYNQSKNYEIIINKPIDFRKIKINEQVNLKKSKISLTYGLVLSNTYFSLDMYLFLIFVNSNNSESFIDRNTEDSSIIDKIYIIDLLMNSMERINTLDIFSITYNYNISYNEILNTLFNQNIKFKSDIEEFNSDMEENKALYLIRDYIIMYYRNSIDNFKNGDGFKLNKYEISLIILKKFNFYIEDSKKEDNILSIVSDLVNGINTGKIKLYIKDKLKDIKFFYQYVNQIKKLTLFSNIYNKLKETIGELIKIEELSPSILEKKNKLNKLYQKLFNTEIDTKCIIEEVKIAEETKDQSYIYFFNDEENINKNINFVKIFEVIKNLNMNIFIDQFMDIKYYLEGEYIIIILYFLKKYQYDTFIQKKDLLNFSGFNKNKQDIIKFYINNQLSKIIANNYIQYFPELKVYFIMISEYINMSYEDKIIFINESIDKLFEEIEIKTIEYDEDINIRKICKINEDIDILIDKKNIKNWEIKFCLHFNKLNCIIQNKKNPTNIYIGNEDKELILFNYDNTTGRIIYTYEEVEYMWVEDKNELIDIITKNIFIFNFFKKNIDSNPIILKNGNDILFLYNSLSNIIIKISSQNILLYDKIKNKNYEIIKNSNDLLLCQWMKGVKNGLLLKELNSRKDIYKILLFSNKEFYEIDSKYRMQFIIPISGTIPNYIDKIEYFYIDLHYTLLYPLNTNIEDLIVLFISLVKTNNYGYLLNFMDMFINLIQKNIFEYIENKNLGKEDNMSNIMKQFLVLFKVGYFNFCLIEYFSFYFYEHISGKTFDKLTFLENIDLKSIQGGKGGLYFSFDNEIKAKIIHDDISIETFKNIVNNFFIPIRDNMNEEKRQLKNISNNQLRPFINLIDFYCGNSTMLEKNIIISLSTMEEQSQTINELNKTFEQDIWNGLFIFTERKNLCDTNIINIGLFNTLNKIFITNEDLIYKKIYIQNIQTILDEIDNIKTENISKLKNCLILGELYRSIDDKVIVSSTPYVEGEKMKEEYERIFEIENGFYIRKAQSEFINNVYTKISRGEINIAYQLLMGRGKTEVITPLIILKEYYEGKKDYEIILPEHLVESSFQIINRYTRFFKKNVLEILKKSTSNIMRMRYNMIYISISSDVESKYMKIEKIKNIKNNQVINQRDSDKLYIMDEIDSMIDPLKSNLNIIQDRAQHFEGVNIYFRIFFTCITKIYEMKENSTFNFTHFLNKIIELYKDNLQEEVGIKVGEIELLKEKINKAIMLCKEWKYNGKDGYGFGNFDYKIVNRDEIERYLDNQNFYTCIPYKYNNTPLNGSKFTDFEILLSTTIFGYIQEWERVSIRVEDLFVIITDYLRLNKEFYINSEFSFGNLAYPVFTEIFKNNLLEFTKKYNNSESYIKLLKDAIENNKEIIMKKLIYLLNEYFVNIIIPKYFKISKKELNISFIDILGFSENKIMFTGTPDFLVPLEQMSNIFNLNYEKCSQNLRNNRTQKANICKYMVKICNAIEKDDYSNASIKASILGTLFPPLLRPKIFSMDTITGFEYNPLLSMNENNLLYFLFIHEGGKIQNYQCLIDVGGIILNTPVNDMAMYIHHYFKNKNIFKHVIYVDSKGKKKIILNNGETQNYNMELYKTSELFIYYNNKNTVGTNIRQPIVMKGLVTFNNKNTLTEIAQGIFRLRKVNITHTIDFFTSNDLFIEYKNIPTNTGKLELLYRNFVQKGEKYKEGTKISMQEQCIKYMNRKISPFKNSYLQKIDYKLFEFDENELYINKLIKHMKDNLKITDINITEQVLLEPSESVNVSVQEQLQTNVNVNININKNIEYQYQVYDSAFKDIPDDLGISFPPVSKIITFIDFINGNGISPISDIVELNNLFSMLDIPICVSYHLYYQIYLNKKLYHIQKSEKPHENVNKDTLYNISPLSLFYLEYENSTGKDSYIITYEEYLNFMIRIENYKKNKKEICSRSIEEIDNYLKKIKIYNRELIEVFNYENELNPISLLNREIRETHLEEDNKKLLLYNLITIIIFQIPKNITELFTILHNKILLGNDKYQKQIIKQLILWSYIYKMKPLNINLTLFTESSIDNLNFIFNTTKSDNINLISFFNIADIDREKVNILGEYIRGIINVSDFYIKLQEFLPKKLKFNLPSKEVEVEPEVEPEVENKSKVEVKTKNKLEVENESKVEIEA